jgi:hypothetical protein
MPLMPCWHQVEGGGYSSYSFLTSALDGVSGQHHALAALYSRYPLDRRWVGLKSGLDTEARENILCLYRESNPSYTVIYIQSIVRHYTD